MVWALKEGHRLRDQEGTARLTLFNSLRQTVRAMTPLVTMKAHNKIPYITNITNVNVYQRYSGQLLDASYI